MLIDPPDYVAIPPALIYGAEDLERELYRALLQITGWLWVTKKHQKPLITTVDELAERWQIADRTVYDRLQRLADRGYLQVSYANTRVYIRPGTLHYTHTPGEPATHYTPGEPAHTHMDQKPDFAQEFACTGAAGASVQTACTSRANSLHEPITISSSCRSDLDPKKQQLQLLLISAGVFDDVAAGIAADPWVTQERIDAWSAAIAADNTVRSRGACLAANLRAHREPPQPDLDDVASHRRSIDGPYGAYIHH